MTPRQRHAAAAIYAMALLKMQLHPDRDWSTITGLAELLLDPKDSKRIRESATIAAEIRNQL